MFDFYVDGDNDCGDNSDESPIFCRSIQCNTSTKNASSLFKVRFAFLTQLNFVAATDDAFRTRGCAMADETVLMVLMSPPTVVHRIEHARQISGNATTVDASVPSNDAMGSTIAGNDAMQSVSFDDHPLCVT